MGTSRGSKGTGQRAVGTAEKLALREDLSHQHWVGGGMENRNKGHGVAHPGSLRTQKEAHLDSGPSDSHWDFWTCHTGLVKVTQESEQGLPRVPGLLQTSVPQQQCVGAKCVTGLISSRGTRAFFFFFFDWSLPGRPDGKSYKPVPSTAMFPGSPGNQVTGCPVFYVTPFVPPPHLRQIRAQHTPTFWVERVDGCFSPQSSTVTSGLPDHRQENESK